MIRQLFCKRILRTRDPEWQVLLGDLCSSNLLLLSNMKKQPKKKQVELAPQAATTTSRKSFLMLGDTHQKSEKAQRDLAPFLRP